MNKNRNLFFLLLVMLIIGSCTTKKNAPIAPRKDFKGNWTIASTSIEGAEGKLNISVFDDAALACFNGSTWVLPNNGYGSYTINAGGDCTGGARQIIWSQRVSSNGVTLFNFKKMDGVKRSNSKDVEMGYSMEVTAFNENSFTAKTPIQFEGKTMNIVYQFVRN